VDEEQSEPETRWLSYSELARIRGTSRESATRIVRKHHWPKRPGNDGTVRVSVPVSFLEARRRDPPAVPPAGQADDFRDPPAVPPAGQADDFRDPPADSAGDPLAVPRSDSADISRAALDVLREQLERVSVEKRKCFPRC